MSKQLNAIQKVDRWMSKQTANYTNNLQKLINVCIQSANQYN